MQPLVWIFRFAILVMLVWFALKNGQEVELWGFPGQSWKAPLVFVMLVTFIAGVVLGLLAWIPTVVKQRREIGKLRRNVESLANLPASPSAAEAGQRDIHGV